ncbi:uncharacterized protein [Panulirus ornatus]|uniref:uncharacterized protein n=1 Tax=Panulirus ornatus TaxID=150431 RepID=UPI003A84345C
MIEGRVTVFLLLGVSALVLSNTADEQQTQTSSHGGHGGGQDSYDLRAMCDNSSDQQECLRRVAVCQRVHRTTGRPGMYHESIIVCAEKLNITLPPVPPGGNGQITYRMWARANPQLRRQIFNCIHGGDANNGGSGGENRTILAMRVREMMSGVDEPELLQEMLDRVDSCPPGTGRLELYRCVMRGCATPQ